MKQLSVVGPRRQFYHHHHRAGGVSATRRLRELMPAADDDLPGQLTVDESLRRSAGADLVVAHQPNFAFCVPGAITMTRGGSRKSYLGEGWPLIICK